MPVPEPTRPRLSALVAWSGACLFAISLSWFVFSYLVRFGSLPLSMTRANAIALDVALFTLFALHHSVLARRTAKAWVMAVVPARLERSLYTWVASLLFLLVCSAWQGVGGTVWDLTGPARLIGVGAQLAGILLTAAGSARLDVLDLAGVRQVQEPDRRGAAASQALETTGLYAVVRHPLYLGWALFVFGIPEMTATHLTFACVSVAYLALAIPFEERSLRQHFGPAYADYQRRVRWRMLPGVY